MSEGSPAIDAPPTVSLLGSGPTASRQPPFVRLWSVCLSSGSGSWTPGKRDVSRSIVWNPQQKQGPGALPPLGGPAIRGATDGSLSDSRSITVRTHPAPAWERSWGERVWDVPLRTHQASW